MVTELQRRKLTQLFRHIDINKDGFIERADYEELSRRISQNLGLQPGSHEDEKLRARYLKNWGTIQQKAHKDGDKKVTEEEYVTALDALLSHPGYFEAFVASDARDILEWQDRDRDGKISQQEYVSFMGIYGVAPKDAEDAFRHLDRDGDGYLDREELLHQTEEFFRGDDPGASGNWLVGPY